MRQMYRGHGKTRQGVTAGGLTIAADGATNRRGVFKLLGAAGVGVVGAGSLRASSTTTSVGTVSGTVSGPGVTDFSGCVVMLKKGTSAGQISPVNSDGSYEITGVPTGKWHAYCVPNGSTPLGVMTYSQKPGYCSGTAITVTASETVEADFTLQPAGPLQVTVNDQSGTLGPGIYVCIYEAKSKHAAVLPTATGNTGYALFANVPLTCKVFAVDPSTNAFTWWDGAQSWDTATVVTLPGQGEGMSITATLTEP
jgi:hypothetical protein